MRALRLPWNVSDQGGQEGIKILLTPYLTPDDMNLLPLRPKRPARLPELPSANLAPLRRRKLTPEQVELEKRWRRPLRPTELLGLFRGAVDKRFGKPGKLIRERPCPFCGQWFGSEIWRKHVVRCDPRGPARGKLAEWKPPDGRKQKGARRLRIHLCRWCQQPFGAWIIADHEPTCPSNPNV